MGSQMLITRQELMPPLPFQSSRRPGGLRRFLFAIFLGSRGLDLGRKLRNVPEVHKGEHQSG